MDSDPLLWEAEETEAAQVFKQGLGTARILALPSLQKPCHLLVSVDKATVSGALAQDCEGRRKVGSRHPICKNYAEDSRMHSVAATTLLAEQSHELTFVAVEL